MLAVLTLTALLGAIAAACSSDSDGDSKESAESTPSETTEETTPRPDGPAATIAGPMTGGKGIFLPVAADPGPALDEAGYTETEYTAAGTATSYTGELPTDGTFALEPGATADYVTRIVVRRPEDPADFNGTVVVEWLNVSGGVDNPPEYVYVQDELLREGYAWVGVSAQLIGIEGGPVVVEAPGAEEAGAGKGLKAIDPERYGELSHPGDAFAYDIYTQVARALRSPGETDPLDGFDVRTVIAVGESQSAFALTTYYNGVQPLANAFDAFLIHSRGGSVAPLDRPDGYIDIASSIGGPATVLRTDQATPVIIVQTEGDVLGVIGYYPARQPDAEHLRLWEIAGSAHADIFQVGEDREPALGCETPINRSQAMFVLRAALRRLQEWVIDGTTPPNADLLEVDTSSAQPTYVLDEVGNVQGGVRTPVVDAPVDVLSGLAPGTPSVICLLLGSTLPIPAEDLAALYTDGDDYLEQYTAATEVGIEAGFLLEDDREEILEGADPSRIAG
jgi:hypothetical protein